MIRSRSTQREELTDLDCISLWIAMLGFIAVVWIFALIGFWTVCHDLVEAIRRHL